MNLRQQLLPPKLEEDLVSHLADLVADIDGARIDECEGSIDNFNRLAQTMLRFEQFQGIYGSENYTDWVRRLLTNQHIQPIADVTRDELIEIVRRAMPKKGDPDAEAYMAIFDANVPRSGASNLIFYPPSYNWKTNTWDDGDGQIISDYDPTPEQIVDWATETNIIISV